MSFVELECAFCGKRFFRATGRYNEAKKFGWYQYCSKECLSRGRTKKQQFVCENCGKIFMRQLSDVSLHNYCSQSCAAVVNNQIYPRKRPEIKFKVCEECGQQFRKSTGNKKYCSMKCRKKVLCHTSESLLDIIRKVAQKTGRVPVRRELRGIGNACTRFFGSWNKAILAAGLRPNRSHSQRMYKRAKTKALDGHLCDSASEAIIDNWLTENSILHKRNAPYPATNHKADWSINVAGNTVFVEYFGLAADSPRYDRAIGKKEAICQQHNIRLIALYPKDIYPLSYLNDNLKQKFKEFLFI